MREVLPGVFHWTTRHPRIHIDVSSYWLDRAGVAIDPLVPSERGLEWFAERTSSPKAVLLSNRHHYRDSGKFAEAFGVTVHASSPGMHEFSDDQPVEPFEYGAELPGGVKAYEAGAICPDDTAFHIPAHSALSVADGVINYGGLGFVPDEHLGDDVDAIKGQIRESYARIAAEADFDNLLVAHGEPVVGGAQEQMRAFTEG